MNLTKKVSSILFVFLFIYTTTFSSFAESVGDVPGGNPETDASGSLNSEPATPSFDQQAQTQNFESGDASQTNTINNEQENGRLTTDGLSNITENNTNMAQIGSDKTGNVSEPRMIGAPQYAPSDVNPNVQTAQNNGQQTVPQSDASKAAGAGALAVANVAALAALGRKKEEPKDPDLGIKSDNAAMFLPKTGNYKDSKFYIDPSTAAENKAPETIKEVVKKLNDIVTEVKFEETNEKDKADIVFYKDPTKERPFYEPPERLVEEKPIEVLAKENFDMAKKAGKMDDATAKINVGEISKYKPQEQPAVVAHELMHSLGLKDRYYDPQYLKNVDESKEETGIMKDMENNPLPTAREIAQAKHNVEKSTIGSAESYVEP